MLLVERERVGIVEEVRSDCMSGKPVHWRVRSVAGVKFAFRCRHRERRAQAHAETGGVEVAGLIVVERVRATGRWRVIAWRLVGEAAEGKAVRIQQRRSEAPWLLGAPGRGVQVLDVVVVDEVTVWQRQHVSLVGSESLVWGKISRLLCHGPLNDAPVEGGLRLRNGRKQ